MPTVIKANEPHPTLVRRLETVNVADHLNEARLVLNKSREEARDILRQAQQEGRRLHQEAEGRGFEAGFRRGYEAGAKAGHEAAYTAAQQAFAAEQAELVHVLEELIAGFEARKRDLFIAAETDLVAFAVRVAEKVTKQVGAVNREAAAANLEAALHLVESRTDLVVHAHPADCAALERFAGTIGERVAQAAHLQVVADETVSPGGCRLSAPDLEVDATLEAQLGQIAVLMVGAKEGAA